MPPKKSVKCLCPTKSDYIYDNQIMELDTPRCGENAHYTLHCPDSKIHGWPICKDHIGFFTMTGIHSVQKEGTVYPEDITMPTDTGTILT